MIFVKGNHKHRVPFAFYNSGIAHYSILSHLVLELNFCLHVGCLPLFEKQVQPTEFTSMCKVAGLASSSTGQPASKQAGAGPGGGLLGNAWLLSLSFVVSFHFHYVHLLSWSHRSNDDNSAITHCENSLHST